MLKPREMTYPAPTTSPCPPLSAHTEPITQGHCRIWHNEAENLMMHTCMV